MRFGRSKDEAEKGPSRGGGGADFIRYLKEGDTTFRILQEPDEWCYFWEHFSPAGFSFACNDEDDCPGCISDNEKMKKVSRKIAFNVLQAYQGNDYVNVYKIGPMVAEKLENRFKRFATVTDRDYTITKFKTSGDRWDFDVEGGMPAPLSYTPELKDIEAMLAEQWKENWGDPVSAQLKQAETARAGSGTARPVRATIAPADTREPPFEEKVFKEEDLRSMERDDLVLMIKGDLDLEPPATLKTSDALVDWLMELQS